MSLAALIARAELPLGAPVALATCDRSGAVVDAVAGRWPNGRDVSAADRFYAASLTKQVTGAAVALLVRAGRLDIDAPVATYKMDLPGWSKRITVGQLLHHTAGLPSAGEIEATLSGHWTEAFALAALRNLPELSAEPGSTFLYSNLGYILLARIVEQVSGQPFSTFVTTQLLDPIGITGMEFRNSGSSDGYEQAQLMGSHLPLTLGDGGLWTTAAGFAAWLGSQNRDTFGIASLVETPGRLNDGQLTDYGWGIGLRRRRGAPTFVHAGGWTGAVAQAVRSPRLGIAAVVLAALSPIYAINALFERAIEEMEPQ